MKVPNDWIQFLKHRSQVLSPLVAADLMKAETQEEKEAVLKRYFTKLADDLETYVETTTGIVINKPEHRA